MCPTQPAPMGRPTSPQAQDAGRLADAVSALAAGASDAALRAQLHALSGIVRNLATPELAPQLRARLEGEIDAAIERGDEPALVASMRTLAALDRARLHPVDWSAAAGD
jgi:hypothetical protein